MSELREKLKSAKGAEKVKIANAALKGFQKELLTQMDDPSVQEKFNAFIEFVSSSSVMRYSWNNQMLLWAQMPTIQKVMGFQAWKSQGRQVKKGEKALVILAPTFFKKKEVNNGVEEEVTIPRFKASSVFDISQTELIDPDAEQPMDAYENIDGCPEKAAQKFWEVTHYVIAKGIKVSLDDTLGGADGASYGGKIRLQQHLPAQRLLAVLFHELAHEELHWVHGKLNPEHGRSIKELQAEMFAYIMMRAVGFEEYISAGLYLKSYKIKPEEFKSHMEAVRKLAFETLKALN